MTKTSLGSQEQAKAAVGPYLQPACELSGLPCLARASYCCLVSVISLVSEAGSSITLPASDQLVNLLLTVAWACSKARILTVRPCTGSGAFWSVKRGLDSAKLSKKLLGMPSRG